MTDYARRPHLGGRDAGGDSPHRHSRQIEKEVPLVFTEKRDNLPAQLPSKAEPGWTFTRGPLELSGQPDVLAVTTAFNMTFRTAGQTRLRALLVRNVGF
jgi:hypothetical protein